MEMLFSTVLIWNIGLKSWKQTSYFMISTVHDLFLKHAMKKYADTCTNTFSGQIFGLVIMIWGLKIVWILFTLKYGILFNIFNFYAAYILIWMIVDVDRLNFIF